MTEDKLTAVDVLKAVVSLACTLFIGIMLGFAIYQAANEDRLYSDGFCTALGGQRVSNEVCNVDGQVVMVVQP